MSVQAALVGLQGEIFRAARADGRTVHKVMPWLLDRRNLEAAWDRVNSADGAQTPGEDGVTCRALTGRWAGWLRTLEDELRRGRYVPRAPRWVMVPKPSRPGALRRLGVLTVRDRVVHAALKQVLEPMLEPTFEPSSFGFRPGRSVCGALAEAVRLLSPEARGRGGAGGAGDALPFGFAAHLDVADCFDTIDHEILLDALACNFGDAEVLRLVGQLLRAGGTVTGPFWRRRDRGLVQGGALSPLLCNFYLHPLDEALAELGQSEQGGVRVLRYADDLLLLARDARLGAMAVARVRRVLTRLRQALRDRRPAVRPIGDGVPWLGVRIRPRFDLLASKLRFGYEVPREKVAGMLARLTEITTPPSQRIDPSVFDLGRWVVSVSEQLREWHDAYAYADNAADVFRAADEHALERVGQLLRGVTGRRFDALRAEYRVRLPRGFWTWQVNGRRLVLLSALPPRRPDSLTRPPPWQRPESRHGPRGRPAPVPRSRARRRWPA